jgi:hypothetical protein
MEINNFILLIVFIIFVLIIYKSIKIYNFNKIENYGAMSIDDNVGHSSDNLEDILFTFKNCEYNNPSIFKNGDKCTLEYTPKHENTIFGNECNSYTRDIPLHYCTKQDFSIYKFNDTEYEIKRNTKLNHFKRIDSDLQLSKQKLEEVLLTGDISNQNKLLTLQKEKLDEIFSNNNDNDDFLGILLEKTLDNKVKFYKIIVDEYSEIEEEDDNNYILYIKKNIDCRGKWEKCKYNSETEKSVRKYVRKINKRGNGQNCENMNNITQICAEWSDNCKEKTLDGIKQRVKEWNRYSPCEDSNYKDELNYCNNDKNKKYIQDDCTQDRDCVVAFENENCYENSDGVLVNTPNILVDSSGNGRCAYEEGKEYHSRREINQYGDTPIELDCNNGQNLEECVCNDREQYSLPCSYDTSFFWGTEDGVQEDKEDNGNCMLEVSDYNPPTSKSGLEECPLNIVDPDDSNNIIDVGNTILENPFTNLNDEMGNYSRKFFKVNLESDDYKFCKDNNNNNKDMRPENCTWREQETDCGDGYFTLQNEKKIKIIKNSIYNGYCRYSNNQITQRNVCHKFKKKKWYESW